MFSSTMTQIAPFSICLKGENFNVVNMIKKNLALSHPTVTKVTKHFLFGNKTFNILCFSIASQLAIVHFYINLQKYNAIDLKFTNVAMEKYQMLNARCVCSSVTKLEFCNNVSNQIVIQNYLFVYHEIIKRILINHMVVLAVCCWQNCNGFRRQYQQLFVCSHVGVLKGNIVCRKALDKNRKTIFPMNPQTLSWNLSSNLDFVLFDENIFTRDIYIKKNRFL